MSDQIPSPDSSLLLVLARRWKGQLELNRRHRVLKRKQDLSRLLKQTSSQQARSRLHPPREKGVKARLRLILQHPKSHAKSVDMKSHQSGHSVPRTATRLVLYLVSEVTRAKSTTSRDCNHKPALDLSIWNREDETPMASRLLRDRVRCPNLR